MTDTNRERQVLDPEFATKWVARVLSVMILLFYGFFIVGHLFGDEGQPSRPLVFTDYLGLTALMVSLSGLAISWKWELVGGFISLSAALVLGLIDIHILSFPTTMIPITAAIFVISWFLGNHGANRKSKKLTAH